MGLYDYDGKRDEPKSKGWPDDGQPADFEKLATPLVRAVRFAYDLKRKNADKDIPWKGPDIGWRERATCLSPKEQLTAERLGYSEEDQGRDPLVEIIGLALRLGIEQGRRITMEGDTVKTLILQAKINRINAGENAESVFGMRFGDETK